MQLPPYYRLWIYSINGMLIVIQLIFVLYSYVIFSHQWTKYFPFNWQNWLVILTYGTIGVQFTVYIGGILGALLFNKTILRIYWLFMIPLLLFDLVKAICWAIQLRDMHRYYSKFIQQITDAQVHYGNSMSICSEWYSIQMGLKCCSPTNILRFCNYTGSIWEDAEMEKLLTLCESKTIYSCANPLLRWFHSEIDLLAIIAYFVLLPLKLIVVGVLRRDIQEVFGEIVYSGNRHLYMHWAAFDSRDEGIALSASLHNNTDTVTSTTALMKTQRTFEE